MNKIKKNLTIFVLLLFSGITAYAAQIECDDAVKIAFEHIMLEEKHELDRNNIVTQDCKIWPTQNNILLLATIYNVPGNPSDSVKRSIVAMIDIPTRRVAASYQGTIHHDGTICVPTYRIKLDTAAYRLTPETRAFGYRIENPGSCPKCIDENDKLTLFVKEGEKLRPVLMNLAMHRNRTLGGCKDFERSEESYMEVAFLTLGAEKTRSHGYADLLLKTKIGYATFTRESRYFPDTKPVYYLLRYDGERYRPHQRTQPWWVWLGAP